MALSNSVLRRYTPPTCTLEIAAKSSPLSRWMGKTVLKDLHFDLRFDDPRKPDDDRLTIRGDAGALEALSEAVSSYVQNILDTSASQLPLFPQASATNATPDDDRRGDLPAFPALDSGIDAIASPSSEERSEKLDLIPPLSLNPKVLPLKPRTQLAGIYLQPKGLLAHELFLGSLATAESGPVVNLSVLQLFDLATALDEYAADGVALPNRNSAGLKKALPPWTPVAAGAILAVGVTAGIVKFINTPVAQQQATAPTAKRSPTGTPPAMPTTGVPPAPTTPLSPTPLATPTVPPPLAASPTLTPPPPVAVLPPISSPGAPADNQRPTITISPPAQNSPVRLKPPIPPTSSGRIASAPSPQTSDLGNSRSASEQAPTERTQPDTTTPPALPDLPELSPNPSSGDLTAQATPSPGNQTSGDVNQAGTASAANADNNTAFKDIPQLGEIRKYFEGKWQPPESLNQTLEYSLLLNGDGSIQRILPLGNAAGQYIDRTNMPLPGEPFVSPLEGGGNPSIRLVLEPDGKVQTFLEPGR